LRRSGPEYFIEEAANSDETHSGLMTVLFRTPPVAKRVKVYHSQIKAGLTLGMRAADCGLADWMDSMLVQ